MNHTLQFMLKQFANAQLGHLTLAAGHHTVEIPLENAADIVFTSIQEEGGSHCGGSDRSMVVATVDDQEVVIDAEIKSDTAVIWWLVF